MQPGQSVHRQEAEPDLDQVRPRVGLFVTCLVDIFRPTVGLAAVRLLEDAGCAVEVPAVQSCCGRNGGADATAMAMGMAKAVIETFEDFDHVVAPSGSCAATLRRYPSLFADDDWPVRAKAFAGKVHELTGFLVDVLGVSTVTARLKGSATYHDACRGLLDLGIREQPRRLLGSVEGLTLKEMKDAGACCGLDGNACEAHAADRTIARIRAAGSGLLLSADLGCLMNMAARLKRGGSAIEVRHVAEVLAGMNDTPPIGGTRMRRAAGRAG